MTVRASNVKIWHSNRAQRNSDINPQHSLTELSISQPTKLKLHPFGWWINGQVTVACGRQLSMTIQWYCAFPTSHMWSGSHFPGHGKELYRCVHVTLGVGGHRRAWQLISFEWEPWSKRHWEPLHWIIPYIFQSRQRLIFIYHTTFHHSLITTNVHSTRQVHLFKKNNTCKLSLFLMLTLLIKSYRFRLIYQVFRRKSALSNSFLFPTFYFVLVCAFACACAWGTLSLLR